jgi:trans-2,3-dihydro-3-hydroxyanthranilate isomerase
MASSRTYRYSVVDVFTETPFEGNPLAVFLDAEGLSDLEMQTIARELNLSETSFVLPIEGDAATARLRIFTPGAEMPFAGHPTIGTAYALVSSGRVPADMHAFVLQENIGPVPIRVERAANPFLAWLRTPPISFGTKFAGAPWARALGLAQADLLGEAYPVRIVSAGNPFLFVPLRDPAAVDRAALEATALQRELGMSVSGVFVFAPVANGAYSRMFAPEFGIIEDPATGSATGPLGAYMAEYGLLPNTDGTHFTSEQGVRMKRRSIIHGVLRLREGKLDTVEIGGSAVKVIDAEITVP